MTSYIFVDGQLDRNRLAELEAEVGKEKVVLDLSCRQSGDGDGDGEYHVVCDRWQTFTDVKVMKSTLSELSQFCDEFLVHGVDVEGKRCGVEHELIKALKDSPIPVTYAV